MGCEHPGASHCRFRRKTAASLGVRTPFLFIPILGMLLPILGMFKRMGLEDGRSAETSGRCSAVSRGPDAVIRFRAREIHKPAVLAASSDPMPFRIRCGGIAFPAQACEQAGSVLMLLLQRS